MAGTKRQLGELLLAAGLVSREQLDSALQVQRASGVRLGEVLVALGYTTEIDVARTLSQQLQIPFLPDHEIQADPQVVDLLPPSLLRQRSILPLNRSGNLLLLAMADPLDVVTADEVQYLTSLAVQPAAVTRTGLDRAMAHFQRVAALKRSPTAPAPDQVELPPELDAAPIVQLVHDLIQRALDEQASDIHLEPGEQQFRIRFRVDGFLRDVMAPSMQSHPPVIARLKVMAGLDISERRLPQDGRIELRGKGQNGDIRVSTLPTIHGEKVVLRLFDKSRSIPAVTDLGLGVRELQQYLKAAQRPHGMLLVTGPTGSGKTTTLLSTVANLAAPEKNVVTIEDPVEYHLQGVNHVQINPKAGLSFADGLRAILRQDPNIIMVGEVRDAETADVAVRAALTGHLVLSTLHTNDAPGALTRLVEMGVEPYLIGAAVNGVLAQRLVRRICKTCRVEQMMDPAMFEAYGYPTEGAVRVYRHQGCTQCRGMGYLHRFPIFEFLPVTAELRDLIIRRAGLEQIREAAHRAGMRSMLANGIDKVLAGETTLEEVFRVVQHDD